MPEFPRLSVKRVSHHRQRALRVEPLESRRLLAGDVFLVNFQLDEATPPAGYLIDQGLVFGDRGNGQAYGWSSDHTDQSRERSLAADQRFDTLIHIEQGQFWEFALPNGRYEVMVAVGDPANNDGLHTINVENINFWNAAPDGDLPLQRTLIVSVSDGRLTIDQGAAANKATRIDFVHIIGLPDGDSPAPAAPVITEPQTDGQLVNPTDVHMEAIGYSDPNGDPHKSTDWEIWTIGTNPEPVWQTLGIQSIEKLHTHLGDGIFLNSLAGRTALNGNTAYELRVRFRDATGAVSSAARRLFTTTAASAALPLTLNGLAASPAPTWLDIQGGAVDLPVDLSVFSPGDVILAVDLDGNSSYPANELPVFAIDGTPAKYLNYGGVNSGFIVSPQAGPTTVTGFRITTANDAPERDPSQWRLYGTNAVIRSVDNSRGTAEGWTLIGSGSLGLPDGRNTVASVVTVANSIPYTSYRMIFTGLKNAAAANAMQVGDIQFFEEATESLQPGRLEIQSAAGGSLMSVTASRAAGNTVVIEPPSAMTSAARIVIESGGQPLVLPNSNLGFTDAGGTARIVYLPAIDLAADQRIDLWVGQDGSTYYGAAAQPTSDLSFLARRAPNDVPFVATRGGFVIEQVGQDYRLPVNIAFVPDPGPNPDDPLYFVTELYGSIQVVTRAGMRHQFATGLLDYNPQGPISGSGEQGLTGIAVERDATDPDVYHLYVTMLWDNGSPSGRAVHYPKVERLDSVSGGLSLAARTVLLNMQPETQGQSHQISNITIGPDGKLYVHNGDGFDASTALNLNSFRGKILRLNKDGSAPTDNPFYNASDGITARDYVYAYGVRNPFGGAWRLEDGRHFSVENGPSVDRMTEIERGASYGWNGSNESMSIKALYNWNPASAPVAMAFIEPAVFAGSQFPISLMGRAFVSESGPTYAGGPQTNGKRIVEFNIDASGNLVGGATPLVEYVGTGRGTIAGLAAGPDGLYFTELYEDSGGGGATAVGARLFRVRYVGPTAIDVPSGQTLTDPISRSGDAQLIKTGGGTLILDRANSHSGGTIVRAGEVIVRDAAALGSGRLAIDAGATVRLETGPAAVTLSAIDLAAGALLDLGQARLTIPGEFDEATLRNWIITARGSGNWDGVSGIGSTAAAALPGSRAIGYARAADGATTIAFTVIGDLDLDNDVDIFDLGAVSASGRYGSGTAGSWSQGDVNYDDKIDVFDLVSVTTAGGYGKGDIFTTAASSLRDTSTAPVDVAAAVSASSAFSLTVETGAAESISGNAAPSAADRPIGRLAMRSAWELLAAESWTNAVTSPTRHSPSKSRI